MFSAFAISGTKWLALKIRSDTAMSQVGPKMQQRAWALIGATMATNKVVKRVERIVMIFGDKCMVRLLSVAKSSEYVAPVLRPVLSELKAL